MTVVSDHRFLQLQREIQAGARGDTLGGGRGCKDGEEEGGTEYRE